MKKIYIDSNFKCHSSNDGTFTAIETNFFDEKCDAFIEGYNFVPAGATWTCEDGRIFEGEMIAPWIDLDILLAYQKQYEIMQAELSIAYEEGVNSI